MIGQHSENNNLPAFSPSAISAVLIALEEVIHMAKAQAADEQCPAELALNILSGKWKLKILWHLSRGTIRFNELQRILGNITTKTLTEQLRELESQGIILRKIYPEVPPRVEYTLTELGHSLKPVLDAMRNWGEEYQAHGNQW